MKKILFAALAAATVALPSCSNDETVAVEKGAAIQLNVSSSRISRSSVVTEANITKFHMWANAGNKLDGFFIDEDVSKSGDAWSYGDLRFWPQTAAVDFVAVYPAELAEDGHNTGKVTPKNGMVSASNLFSVDYTVVDGSEDFAYAANYGQTKQTTAVQLNFRHALSQIIFKAYNSNTAVLDKVKIKNVRVVNVANKGTFKWATAATNDKHPYNSGEMHTDTNQETEWPGGSWGTWTVNTEAEKVAYTNNLVASEVVLSASNGASAETAVDLTAQSIDPITKACTGGLLLLPQTITSWDFTNSELKTNGSYFAIECQIIDKNCIQLYPANNGEYQEVLIPIPAGTWKQGMRYTYIFNFGKGAGYTPGTNPEPVLFGISVSVTVDEFQSAANTDVDMNKKKA